MDHESSRSIKYHNTEILSEGFCFSEIGVALIVYLWLYVWILNKEVLSCVGKHTHCYNSMTYNHNPEKHLHNVYSFNINMP